MSHSWVEIDLDALRHNVRVLQNRLLPTTEIIAMVKGNAYGHGAVEVARAVLSAGATRLGVATVAEGVELRRAGLTAPILVLGGYDPDAAEGFFVYDLTPVVGDPAAVQDLETRARRLRQEKNVHLHVDTGMGRLGVAPKKAGFLASNVMRSPFLHLEGVSSHLATADEPDVSFAQLQLRRFHQALERVRAEGIPTGLVHMANTAAVLRFPETMAFQAVRPGLGLYGMVPDPCCLGGAVELAPVMQWRTRVVRVEKLPAGSFVSYGRSYRLAADSHIATLSAGYGDGYPRALSNKGRVLIEGRRYPIVGRVTMDHFMVDLGPETAVRTGAMATLLGKDGAEELKAEEISGWYDAIPYEVTTGVAPRVERRYLGAQADGRVARLRSIA